MPNEPNTPFRHYHPKPSGTAVSQELSGFRSLGSAVCSASHSPTCSIHVSAAKTGGRKDSLPHAGNQTCLQAHTQLLL